MREQWDDLILIIKKFHCLLGHIFNLKTTSLHDLYLKLLANKFDIFLIQCVVHYGGNPFLEKKLDNLIVIDSKLLNQLLAWKFVLANLKYVNTYGCCWFNCFCTHDSITSLIHLPATPANWWCSWNVNVQICKDNIQRLFVVGSHSSLHTLKGIVGLLAPIFLTLWKQTPRKKKFKIITMEKKKIQVVFIKSF